MVATKYSPGGGIRTRDLSLAGRAQGAHSGAMKLVAPAGFEPAISASPGARRAHIQGP